MAQITSYSTLQDAVTSWLMRGADTTFQADVPTMIQLAEAKLKRDSRVRSNRIVDPVAISSEVLNLPSDYKSLVSLTLTGPTYFGFLNQVSMSEFEDLKGRYGDSAGPPTHFAITGTQLYIHPTPDQAYEARLVYERTITSLSTSTTINWLLTSHPDIYLYATLCEAAPYLKDDNRLQMWQMLLAERLEELHSQRQFSDLSSQAQPNTGVTFGG